MEAGKPSSVVFMNNKDRFTVCVKSDRYLNSLGVWVGDKPLDFAIPITLCQIIVINIVTRALCYLLKPLKTPKFICCVLGGILVGQSFMGQDNKFTYNLFPKMQSPIQGTLARMGVVYFVFIIALKMDVVTTLRSAKRCWLFAVIPFGCSFIVTTILLFLYRPHGGVNYAVQSLPKTISLSSFAVISEALLELKLITTELGQITLSTAMACEIMQCAFLILGFAAGKGMLKILGFMTSGCAFLLLCAFVVRPMMKMIIQRTPIGTPVREGYVVLILLSVLVASVVGDVMGISYFVGPLIFGLVIPNGPPLATTIIDKSELVILDLLMPFFYATIGLNTNFREIGDWQVVMMFQLILFVGFLAKVLACAVVAPTYNISPQHGMILGLMLSIKGILELLFFTTMKNNKFISGAMYSQLVLYIVLMTATCVPLIKWLYKQRRRVSKVGSAHEGRARTIQSSPETSELNIICCVHHDENVHSAISLLESCNPSVESPIRVHVIHLIELLGKSAPILLPLNTHHNRKSLSVNYPNTGHIVRAFHNYSRNSKGPVTVLCYANVAPYNSMHEAVCNLAEEKSVPFLVTSFHENDQHALASSFQVHAQCTVGILVDKHLRLGLSGSKFSFHVAILFIGGPDDREALALGIRMLERVNTRVALFRFVMDRTTAREREEEEEMLDNSLIDEFKGKMLSNDNTILHEVVAEGSVVNVLEAIRGMEMEIYDLVMVGKKHCVGSFTDEEMQMTEFMHNADQLGVVGDMLASKEFCDGKIPLLVMQCGEERVKIIDNE